MTVCSLHDLLFSRVKCNRSQSTESLNFTLGAILRWSKWNTRSQVLKANEALSIVAVHGLYENALQTWTSDRSNALWLRDAEMLPMVIPNARILTWGYNTDVHAFLGHTSSNGVMQHAHTLVAQLQTDREVCLALTSRSSQLAMSPDTMLLTTNDSDHLVVFTEYVFDRMKVLQNDLSFSCAMGLEESLLKGYQESLCTISCADSSLRRWPTPRAGLRETKSICTPFLSLPTEYYFLVHRTMGVMSPER